MEVSNEFQIVEAEIGDVDEIMNLYRAVYGRKYLMELIRIF